MIDLTASSLMPFTVSPGGHTVFFNVFFIFPELLWDSADYCVCFLLPGPTCSLVKSKVMQQTATQINCHLQSVNGGVKNGEGPIVTSH